MALITTNKKFKELWPFGVSESEWSKNFLNFFLVINASWAHITSNEIIFSPCSHSRVAKTAFKVFVTAAKLVTFKEPMAFDQIWNLTLTLNPTLQLLLRKKLKAAILTLPPMILDLVRNILEGHNEGLSPTSHQNR